MNAQPTTPAARPCVWPNCLTETQHAELAAQVTAEEKGQHRPPMPDQRPICGCTEATPTTPALHACGNCEGIDPDTCLANPDRPRAATTPAPVDPALRDRVAAVIRHALKTRTAPALTDYAGRPISGTESGLTEHDLAAAVLAELAPELARAEQAETALTQAIAERDHLARPIANAMRQTVEEVLADTRRALTGPAEETP